MPEMQAATDLLEAIAGYGVEDLQRRPVKLGTIDPNYSSGLARVRFDGESTVSGKGYAWLGPYVPQQNDRVSLLPVGTSYLILGALRTTPGGDFRIAGTASGLLMQSPDGSYWRLSPSNAGASVWTKV